MRVRAAWDGKNELRLETDIRSSQSQEAIRCWFRMRSGTAGLFAF